MKYRELIKRMQHLSGFSDAESKDALQLLVEAISVRLTEGERKDFASQLPMELKDLALSVYPTKDNSGHDILRQFMEIHNIPAARAKKQMKTAWKVIKEAISTGEIDDVKAQLPNKTVSALQ